jgi:hypothetical protein
MRESRINLIIEGTSEIMRLFIAREALDAHLKLVGDAMDPSKPSGAKAKALGKATMYYALWWPRQWASMLWTRSYRELGPLARHVRYVERTSHRLALALFHGAVKYQARLAYRQQLLGRLVDTGAELFAMVAACSKAHRMMQADPHDRSPEELADFFCRGAKQRI